MHSITTYKLFAAFSLIMLIAVQSVAQSVKTDSKQKAYFIDGFHGGFWGHYPANYTSFIVEQLKAHPDWKINLEIEPETWDMAKAKDPEGYEAFKAIFANQNIATRRIEYVSPAYGQSYMYNVSGESIIRQFSYGMEMLRKHFPSAVFSTYSSEEPCFTSALPQILKSFGYKYASLKNPNTLWGGYTRAHGGELVNWIGPDGTGITTVPRYAMEALKPGSTWETIGNSNSKTFINAAFKAGIKHPAGFTLQDAGWKGGPYAGNGDRGYQPTEYKTWTDYVDNYSIKKPTDDWKFSQEDVLTSLVWGSQILQRIAQQVRVSENKLIVAEKLAAMASVYKNAPWPKAALDEGWTRLLLSQHHDCWIVPYNMGQGNTWADKVVTWTGITNKNTANVIDVSINKQLSGMEKGTYAIVFNSLGVKRNEVVKDSTNTNWGPDLTVVDGNGKAVPLQRLADGKSFLFKTSGIPSMGYTMYRLLKKAPPSFDGAKLIQANGKYKIETDLYSVIIDPARGGTIESLVAKKMGNKEFVDKTNARRFNELRGNFFKDGGFKSSTDQPAEISVLENGPLQISLQVKGMIANNPFTQLITFTQGQRRIDISLKIDWQGNPGIGNPYGQTGKYDATSLQKAFYDDRDKLLALFPLNLKGQKVYKNAPFDVTESKLDNTFFTRWDSIKNNVLLNWVDVTDSKNAYGMALLTDHTTNYAHGRDFPLGLDVAYSGIGLWGRNYSLKYPTQLKYALVPHAGKWDKASIWAESDKFNEPLDAAYSVMGGTESEGKLSSSHHERSLLKLSGSGLEISSVTMDGKDLLVRLFNAESDGKSQTLSLDAVADKAEIVALNGDIVKSLPIHKTATSNVSIAMPRFGIKTVRFSNVRGK